MYKRMVEFSIKFFGFSFSFKHHIELPEAPKKKENERIERIEPTLNS